MALLNSWIPSAQSKLNCLMANSAKLQCFKSFFLLFKEYFPHALVKISSKSSKISIRKQQIKIEHALDHFPLQKKGIDDKLCFDFFCQLRAENVECSCHRSKKRTLTAGDNK